MVYTIFILMPGYFRQVLTLAMGGRKKGYGNNGFGRYGRLVKSHADYVAEAGCRRLRGIIANGGSTRFMPKYPNITYRPESSLYGMQGLGMYCLRSILGQHLFRNYIYL